MVPGQKLWRTRVVHEKAAVEAFNAAWEAKQEQKARRRPPPVISDASYKEAMSELAALRDDIRKTQSTQIPPSHGPRGLPDRPKVGNFSP